MTTDAGYEFLTKEDLLKISAVVHQDYRMSDVFDVIEAIVKRHASLENVVTTPWLHRKNGW